MAGANPFYKMPDEVIQKLGFLGTPTYYLYKDTALNSTRGVLFEVTEGDFGKLFKRLQGTKGEIEPGDLVYVIPNCRIPLFKLKHYLDEVGAKITNDVSQATKIIGHTKSMRIDSFRGGGASLLVQISGPSYQDNWLGPRIYSSDPALVSLESQKEKAKFEEATTKYKDLSGEYKAERTILSGIMWRPFTFTSVGKRYFITPTGAWVMYNHMLSKTPIISEDSIFEKLGKPVIIDLDTYESLNNMLKSSDSDNHKVAGELMGNADIDQSLYYIWKLSKEHGWTLRHLSKFKNIRLFLRMSRWDELCMMDCESITEYMFSKGLMTKEYFGYLYPQISSKYGMFLNSSVLKLVITPNELYSAFDRGYSTTFEKELVLKPEMEIIEEDEI